VDRKYEDKQPVVNFKRVKNKDKPPSPRNHQEERLADSITAIMLNGFMAKRKTADRGGKSTPPANRNGSYWIYGVHAVLAAVANPCRRRRRLLVAAAQADTLGARLEQASLDGGPAPESLGRREIEALLPAGAVHQGLALLADPLPDTALEDIGKQSAGLERARLVVLDQVTDPRNVGAVLRSAAAFGAGAVIIQTRRAPAPTGAMAKAASGALETVPLVRVTNISRALARLKDWGFWCAALDARGERSLEALPAKVALVLGSEGRGLRRLTRESCDMVVRIPIAAGMENLNLSTAAAIALYDSFRGEGAN
jgi:23S rRNA (guanosine2251-2'-O)-methyltransferase